MLKARDFWPREGTVGVILIVLLGVWYLGAVIVNGLIELYASVWHLGEPHTWLDYFDADNTGVPLGKHKTGSDSWPLWASGGPLVFVFTLYPIVFILDGFQSSMQLLTRKSFPRVR